jgi:hypothetical protein
MSGIFGLVHDSFHHVHHLSQVILEPIYQQGNQVAALLWYNIFRLCTRPFATGCFRCTQPLDWGSRYQEFIRFHFFRNALSIGELGMLLLMPEISSAST